jgi:hypothetical protein
MGLSVRGAVVTIYGAGVVLGGVALLMSQLGSSARIVGVVGLLVAAVAVAVPLARVHVYGERRRPGTGGKTGDGSLTPGSAEVEAPNDPRTGGNGQADVVTSRVSEQRHSRLQRRA